MKTFETRCGFATEHAHRLSLKNHQNNDFAQSKMETK
jgi:hypothetical protein